MPSLLLCNGGCGERVPSSDADEPHRLVSAGSEGDDPVYLVAFREDEPNPAQVASAVLEGIGGKVGRVFEHAFRGAVVQIPEEAVEAVRRNPQVVAMEEEVIFTPDGMSSDTTVKSTGAWNLDRVDQRPGSLDGSYRMRMTGLGVHIWVLDLGVQFPLDEFEFRMHDSWGFGKTNDPAQDPWVDCHPFGHGTPVASLAAGKDYGVAPSAFIHSMHVGAESGCTADPVGTSNVYVNAAIDQILATGYQPSVVVFAYSSTVENAGVDGEVTEGSIQNLVDAGIPMAVSAGQDHEGPAPDACDFFPASYSTTVAVAGTNSSDVMWSPSARGTCVDILAPAQSTQAIDPSGAVDSFTGNSAASPIVAGALALVKEEFPWYGAQQAQGTLFGSATKDVIPTSGGTPSALLFTLYTKVGVIGPTNITESGMYQWDASPIGGSGYYTYQWQTRATSSDSWQDLVGETAGTYSRTLGPADSDFQLRVEMTSWGDTVLSETNFVDVDIPCPEDDPLVPC